MAVVSINYLLEAGVHFGHQTKRWNPKMKEYIFTAREDIHIIDLQKTVQCIEEAYAVLKEIAEKDGKILFVGTKKQAQEAVQEEAERTNMYYINERWLGGTLTNFKTIRRRIGFLAYIEKIEQNGTLEKLPKKEAIKLKKEYNKVHRNLVGIREMIKLPQAVIVVDPLKELIAIREAKKLNIPIIGIVDTNCDPDLVDYVVPANDDAIRSIKVVLGVLNNAIAEVTGAPMVDYVSDEDKANIETKVEEPKEEDKKVVTNEEPKKDIIEEVEKEEVKSEEPKKVDEKALKVKDTKEEEKEAPKKATKKETLKSETSKEEKKVTKKSIKKEEKEVVEKKPKTTKKVEEKK